MSSAFNIPAGWTAKLTHDGRVAIYSDDFAHDVKLIVFGDFRNEAERLTYATDLAARMSAPPVDAVPACKGSDSFCPCQDGDACHYAGKDAWPVDTVPGEPLAQDVALWQLVYGAMLGTDKTPKSVDDLEAAAKRVAEMIERRQLAAPAASLAVPGEPVATFEQWAKQRGMSPERLDAANCWIRIAYDEAALAASAANGRAIIAPAAAAEPSELSEMEARKDAAYLERNQVVAALAKCFPSGVARTAIEGWSEDWHGCVYIDLPTGQASWHFHDSQAYLFADLPPYTGEWDGHDTPEKYRRLAALPDRERAASLVAGEEKK